MTAREQLAKLICSDVTLTINDLEKRYMLKKATR